ncbi:hypothetical protein [Actinomadura monticuli]|uniref:Uncharacterized protein n=1 Tax=Actinomadura monticuli TaxID=3097367 RepID=A0ABV4QK63_9ACTN
MSRSVVLLSSAIVGPAEFLEVVRALGGEPGAEPGGAPSGELERDEGRIWVHPYEPDTLPYGPPLLDAYARKLGAPPRSRVVVEFTSAAGSEWLVAEYVLAVADRWPVVVDDLGEQIVGMEEFQDRLSDRYGGFFVPDASYDAAPAAARRRRVTDVTLILPAAVDPGALKRLARSLGARMDPDEHTDALLQRGAGRVWLRLDEPGAAPVEPGKGDLHRRVLGDAPYNSVSLEVLDTGESQPLAAELIQAAAARWPVLIRGASGRVMTAQDVQDRVAAGTHPVLDR